MDKLIIYLICINILGAVLDGVTAARRRRTSHKALSVLLGIIAIAGGAPGMIIAFALCDRTASKTNMMLRVFTVYAYNTGATTMASVATLWANGALHSGMCLWNTDGHFGSLRQ